MTIIELKDVILHGYHGVNDGEAKTGNNYKVNLLVTFNEGNSNFNSLNDTISYVELYDIVRQRMQAPTPLLEKLCNEILQDIQRQFPFIAEVRISIFKLQAPIQNFEGKVGVSLHKVYHE